MESIHKGHRGRIRKRFSLNGLEGFSDVEAIEMLLFYALPRRNTNELAHELLHGLGGFRGVFEARDKDLMRINGIGENAAQLIRLVAELGRRYMISGRREDMRIHSSADAGRYLAPLFSFETIEQVYMLCMDESGRIRSCCKVAQGNFDKVDFSSRDILNAAMNAETSRVIIAHNHPSNSALPSSADIAATQTLIKAFRFINVELYDHIIICGSDFISLRESGYIN